MIGYKVRIDRLWHTGSPGQMIYHVKEKNSLYCNYGLGLSLSLTVERGPGKLWDVSNKIKII